MLTDVAPVVAIETSGLTKHYGHKIRALESLDLVVRQGEVFGFLGPNGAGKSTTIRLLLGFLHPTSGSGRVLGLDIVRDSVAIRRRIGYLPGGIALYDTLTGERLLDYLGRADRPSAGAAPRAVRSAGAVVVHPETARPRLLARHAPEDRHRPGAAARSRAGDSRRAVEGPRPADAAGVLRDPRRAQGRRAGPSSSRRTSSPRWSASATASRSSGREGSSRWRRRPRSWRGGSGTCRCVSPGVPPRLDGVPGVSAVERSDGLPAGLKARTTSGAGSKATSVRFSRRSPTPASRTSRSSPRASRRPSSSSTTRPGRDELDAVPPDVALPAGPARARLHRARRLGLSAADRLRALRLAVLGTPEQRPHAQGVRRVRRRGRVQPVRLDRAQLHPSDRDHPDVCLCRGFLVGRRRRRTPEGHARSGPRTADLAASAFT